MFIQLNKNSSCCIYLYMIIILFQIKIIINFEVWVWVREILLKQDHTLAWGLRLGFYFILVYKKKETHHLFWITWIHLIQKYNTNIYIYFSTCFDYILITYVYYMFINSSASEASSRFMYGLGSVQVLRLWHILRKTGRH
jgi:hypothetical protein